MTAGICIRSDQRKRERSNAICTRIRLKFTYHVNCPMETLVHFSVIMPGGQDMGDVPRLDFSETATPNAIRKSPTVAIA